MSFDKIDQLAVNTIRTLSIDMIQAANSGHPGLPLGSAPMSYVLWTRHLKVNPKTARKWDNRDRFVLSAGHGSAMLYSLLYLSGFNLSLDDLKNFRKLDSKTPGHPEVNFTDGVEATTGPLGQGVAMAVGMSMAEVHLAATYNQDHLNIVNHYTYALVGDGDLMEGVSQEAASLAGHLKLGKLIVLYDSNDISLDGPTSMAFTDQIGKKFTSYGWQYIKVDDGNDLEAIDQAIQEAKLDQNHPTLIEVKTTIGFGSPNQGTSKVHGAPLGTEGVKATKKALNWDYPEFTVPSEVMQRFAETIGKTGAEFEDKWESRFQEYQKLNPELALQYQQSFSKKLPSNWDHNLPTYELGDSKASRVTSKETIQVLSKALPDFWGGSADLSASNNTMVLDETAFQPGNYQGRNIWFGVREFAMAACLNGITLHGGTRAYGGTFFVFSNYLLPAIRMSSLQELPVTYVLTHDSVAVGEDGPTHEPIEQLASLRSMPNLHVIRPADGNEVVASWKLAIESQKTPTALILSRQNLPVLSGTKELAPTSVAKGAYVLSKARKAIPDGILIATGSEVKLALEAQAELWNEDHDVSVVSMPAMDLFDQQAVDYQNSVLPPQVTKRVAIEAATSFGWGKYVGLQGATVTIDHYGASGDGAVIMEKFGFTVDNVVETFLALS